MNDYLWSRITTFAQENSRYLLLGVFVLAFVVISRWEHFSPYHRCVSEGTSLHEILAEPEKLGLGSVEENRRQVEARCRAIHSW